MNLSVLIIEDNFDDTAKLVEFLNRIPYIVNIKTHNSAQDALTDLIQGTYELVFLDLEIPQLSGMELLQSMSLPPTIIVSAYPSYAITSYDIDSVVDFIEKPLTFPRLLRALKRAQTAIEFNEVKHLYLKVGRQIRHFSVENIQYIEADGIYSKVWMKDGSYTLANDNISEIESKLLHTRIVRLHKSYIFNVDAVTAFDSRNIWLGESKFQLGVHYRGKLGQLLHLDGLSE